MGYFDSLLESMRSEPTAFTESFEEESEPNFDKEMSNAVSQFKPDAKLEEDDLDAGSDSDDYGAEGCSGGHCEDDEINGMLSDMFGGDDDLDDDDDIDLSDLDSDDFGPEDDEDYPEVDVPVELESVLGNTTPAEPLSKDDDEEADRIMAMSATPILANSVMTEEEALEFIESGDADIAVSEGLMLEEDVAEIASALMDDTGVYTESVFAAPGKKFKMTKKARMKQLYELSIQIEARQHNDPYYPRMQKAYKTERLIKEHWRKKYGALALRRAKKYLKKLSSSKASGLKNMVSKITGKSKKK